MVAGPFDIDILFQQNKCIKFIKTWTAFWVGLFIFGELLSDKVQNDKVQNVNPGLAQYAAQIESQTYIAKINLLLYFPKKIDIITF